MKIDIAIEKIKRINLTDRARTLIKERCDKENVLTIKEITEILDCSASTARSTIIDLLPFDNYTSLVIPSKFKIIGLKEVLDKIKKEIQ